VLIEVDMHQLEAKFSAMIPEFARGAVVHVQSHGYWPAARLTPLLRRAVREDVLVTEAPAPTHAARVDGAVVTPKGLRSGIQVATVPAARSDEALARLKVRPPYVLFVGTIEPRKNLVRLVRAYRRVAESGLPHALVLAGPLGWHRQALLRELGYIVELGEPVV